ncbi:hypothetical protein OAG73_01880, partial [bacterium]|nr:hypothetical protein [bacterium]
MLANFTSLYSSRLFGDLSLIIASPFPVAVFVPISLPISIFAVSVPVAFITFSYPILAFTSFIFVTISVFAFAI